MNSAESPSTAAPIVSSVPPAAQKLAAGQLLTVLLVVMTLLGIASAWGTIRHKSLPVDFYQFWALGQALGRPEVASIYSEADRQPLSGEYLDQARRGNDAGLEAVTQFCRKIEAVYSPLFYVCFKIGSTGEFETDLRNYRLLLLGSFVFGLVVIARLTGHGWRAILGLLILFLVWYDPLYSDLAVGNINGLQLAMLAVYVWIVVRLRWKWRDLLGGLCLGLVVAFKPNLVFVGAMLTVDWIICGQIRRLGWHAAGAMLAIGLALMIGWVGFGNFHCWTDWIATLRAVPGEVYQIGHGNYAPSRIIGERLNLNLSLPLIIIYGGLAVFGTWLRRRDGRSGLPPALEGEAFSRALPVATGALLLLLVGPLAWEHYFVLAVPMFVLLLSPVAMQRPTVRPMLVQAILVLLAFLCFTVNVLTALGLEFSSTMWGVLNAVGMSILFLLAVFARVRPNAAESHPPVPR